MSSKTKPTIVWALYTVSLVAVLTSFFGIVLAYVWRGSDPNYKEVYDKQIRRFWTAGIGWALGLTLFVFAAFTDTRPAGSGVSLLGNVGLLIIIITQLWFALSALISMFLIPAPSSNGKTPRKFA
ncbi:Uncharacterized membrane protein [Ruegeria halocynthiae]|uniref:Uncharacterized membrane protein n=1 Tax=Ruegeria halocynthiae TaxID=985054 RepID=A0A1H3CVM5_9RHOB|nr:hypothetical protein [Ruegeria halocynthiae]SDX57499.1 Uncharacterized membrane protein [Ruegeria halocynthiae]